MARVLNRAGVNFLRQHPGQLALAVLGIALGVAVVVAIDLAMASSLDAFDRANRALSGKANVRIVAGDGGLDETLYTRLRVEYGIQNISPVVKGSVGLANASGQSLTLVGIDPFIESSFQTLWQYNADDPPSSQWLNRLVTEPNTALVGRETALRYGWRESDVIDVDTEQGPRRLTIIALLSPDNAVAKQLLSRLIITDVATAQEVLGSIGRLNAIDVLADSEQESSLARIRAALPKGVLLATIDSQTQAMREMTRAYDVNLQAMGLLSLLIGVFLIYNTMTFLVLQRRRLFGTLRALGVTRRQIFQLILQEALLLAGAGIVLGIPLGLTLGQGVLALVSETINAFYFRVDATPLSWSFWHLAKAVLLGLFATLLAVLPPAWSATRIAPATVLIRSQMEHGMQRLFKVLILTGIVSLFASLALTLGFGQSLALGLVGVFLGLFGFALAAPAATGFLMRIVEALFGRLGVITGRLPARLIRAEISRTGVAIAALTIAVAATIGMDLMIGSFRKTVADWLETTLRADFYVSILSDRTAVARTDDDHRLKARLEAVDGVDRLSSVFHTKLWGDERLTKVSVYELIEPSRKGFVFKHAVADDLWRRFDLDATVFVTEAYAYFHDIDLGSRLRLRSDHGDQFFEVIGIVADYSGDRGHWVMSRRNYLAHWPDLGFYGLGVYLKPEADIDRVERELSKLLNDRQILKSNRAIFGASMQLFEQTFAVTETLRWLSALIAVVGVFSSLMVIQFERKRELGTLRAIGVTPGQLTGIIVAGTGLMGLAAGLLAVPAGFYVAQQLIAVVYRRSFGWTLTFQADWSVIIQGLALALAAALLAGLVPALKMAKTDPAEALRQE